MKTPFSILSIFTALLLFGSGTSLGAETSRLMFDWNADGILEKATLSPASDAEYKNLNIEYSPSTSGNATTKSALNFAWSGQMAGTFPSLAIHANNSLIVKSGNTSIGRSRWNQEVYIALRNEKPVIAGFIFSVRDTLKNQSSRCDVNFLTGTGYLNFKTLSIDKSEIGLTDWNEELVEKICGDL